MRKTESFNAVAFMREARNRMSREMLGKSPQEQIAYIRDKARLSPRKQLSEIEPFLACDKPRDK